MCRWPTSGREVISDGDEPAGIIAITNLQFSEWTPGTTGKSGVEARMGWKFVSLEPPSCEVVSHFGETQAETQRPIPRRCGTAIGSSCRLVPSSKQRRARRSAFPKTRERPESAVNKRGANSVDGKELAPIFENQTLPLADRGPDERRALHWRSLADHPNTPANTIRRHDGTHEATGRLISAEQRGARKNMDGN
jgi:hypothetical protein